MQYFYSMWLVGRGEYDTVMFQSLPFDTVLSLALIITIIAATVLNGLRSRDLGQSSCLSVSIIFNLLKLLRRLLFDFFVVGVSYHSFGGIRLCRHCLNIATLVINLFYW